VLDNVDFAWVAGRLGQALSENPFRIGYTSPTRVLKLRTF
jgi:hypothetical protein